MNRNVSALTKIIAVAFITALFAIGASAQIRIGNIEIKTPKTPKDPQPNKPPTTNPTVTTPNSNGNKTPTSTRNTRVETGATRDQVSEFNKDIAPYREGMNSLLWWSTSTDSIRSGCGEV